MTEKTYYEKILISSGEVPEVTGDYNTDDGMWKFDTSVGLFTMQKEDDNLYCSYNVKLEHFAWWLKPVPSPKQEAMRFAEMVQRFTVKYVAEDRYLIDPAIWPDDKLEYTLSELYDKFKEEKK